MLARVTFVTGWLPSHRLLVPSWPIARLHRLITGKTLLIRYLFHIFFRTTWATVFDRSERNYTGRYIRAHSLRANNRLCEARESLARGVDTIASRPIRCAGPISQFDWFCTVKSSSTLMASLPSSTVAFKVRLLYRINFKIFAEYLVLELEQI